MGEGLARRDNALNFLRLMLATAVIVGHAYYLSAHEPPSPWLGPRMAEWAVNGFFAISGYLIAGSRMRLSLATYLVRRARRLLPGFWTALLVVAFVISPLVAWLGDEHWSARSAMGYVLRNLALWIDQPYIAGTLLSTPTNDTMWNVPLWTLSYEAGCYVLFGLLLSIPLVRRHGGVVCAALLALLMAAHPFVTDPDQAALLSNAVRLASYFTAGVLVWFFRDRIPLRWWVPTAALSVLGVIFVISDGSWYGQLPAAVALLAVGGMLPVRVGSTHDISYGVYVYGWPVQQSLANLGMAALGVMGFLVLSLAVVTPIAWASWWLVERRWLPQRRPSQASVPLAPARAPGS